MALNSRPKRGHYRIKSTDSESDIPIYKKERITRAKSLTKKLQTFCDNDSPIQTSTENGSVKQRSNAINKNRSRSPRPQAVYKTRIVSTSSDSDTTSPDQGRLTKGKQSKRRKSNVNIIHISESSWSSTDSLIQNKTTFLRSSSINKQNNNEDSENEFIDPSLVTENKSKEKDREANIVSSTPIVDTRVIEKQKQDIPTNFKPQVTKLMEEMKCKFARFLSQISRFQERYFKEETVDLEDAKDIIFILTCIISKLKEEFTEDQQKLMDFCFQTSMKHNSKRIVSNLQDKQILNDNHLQVQSLIHSSPNSWNASSPNNDEPVFSQNTHVERSLQATKTSTNPVQLSNKDQVSRKDNKINNAKSALETNNCLISDQNNEDNVVVPNNKRTLPIPNNITKSKDMKGTTKGPTRSSSETKDNSKTSAFSFRQPAQMTRNLSKTILNSDDDMLHGNSDVDSTCSTVNLVFSYNINKQPNNQTTSSTNECGDKTKNNVVDKVTLNTCDDDSQRSSLHRVSSCENIFSDKDSIKCSSVSDKERFPVRNNNNQTNSVYHGYSFDTIFPNRSDNEDIQRKSLCRFNSEETLIIPNRVSMNRNSCSFVRKRKRLPTSNENAVHEPDSEFIVPNADSLNKKHRSKYVVDKKLRMDCRVLIKRCNLNLS